MAADDDSLSPHVVVVEDDPTVRLGIGRTLRNLDFRVDEFPGARAALEFLNHVGGVVDVVMSDLHMPEMDGMGLLDEVHRAWPDVSFVVLTADCTAEPAIMALRAGAYDYLSKPLPPAEHLKFHLLRAVQRSRLLRRTRRLERQLDVETRFEGMVGRSPAIQAVFSLVESVARTDTTVLVTGESGTGKELVARAIHARSQRAKHPFLAVNCSALAEQLLESELFGHVRGAFSGATSARQGLFEEASGGTLFLDEIGDISPGVQVRLLRVLQEGEVKPVGADEVRKVDVRVITATNRDLAVDIAEGDFREDLYYRLNVIAVELPALRDRPDDIPLLVAHFLEKYARRFGRELLAIDQASMKLLASHPWPGNVRELENVIQRAVVLCRSAEVTVAELPPAMRDAVTRHAPDADIDQLPFSEERARVVADFERRYIRELLGAESGNVTRAAKRAGLDKANLRRLARRYGIDLGRLRL